MQESVLQVEGDGIVMILVDNSQGKAVRLQGVMEVGVVRDVGVVCE